MTLFARKLFQQFFVCVMEFIHLQFSNKTNKKYFKNIHSRFFLLYSLLLLYYSFRHFLKYSLR